MRIRTYSELRHLDTFEDRFAYLKLSGVVSERTFGGERWLNQRFYSSPEWKRMRKVVIARDNGCDLGLDGLEIHDKVIIHHMNPMAPCDLIDFDERIMDPEFLISSTLRTHNAIHYGDENQLSKPVVERAPRDHILW